MAEVRTRGKPKYSRLAINLKRMAWLDQATIWAAKPFEPVRNRHCEAMKKIIQEYGWPTISKVGEQASNEAWLLVQHCDHDIDFQKKCLSLLKKEVAKDGVAKKNVALLDDRIRMNLRKPQLYGTQVIGDFKRVRPYQIWKPENVDERRKRMGLIPLKDYLTLIRRMNKYWGGKRPKSNAPCLCGSGKKYKKCHGRNL